MMRTVNIHRAKTQISRLVDAAERGAEIVIVRAGRLLARLVPIKRAKVVRRFGTLKWKVRIADDFDAPLFDAHFAA
jgi:prevent-host-death family protein